MLGYAKHFTLKLGEYAVSTAATGDDKYYGGSPLALQTSAARTIGLCKSGTRYIGIAARSSYQDLSMEGARGYATVYNSGYFRLQTFTASAYSSHLTPTEWTNEGYPYLTTDGWTAGDSLYIDSDGKWTKTNPGSQTAYGRVEAVGSSNSYLDIVLFSPHDD